MKYQINQKGKIIMLPTVPYPVINDFTTEHPVIAGCILIGSIVTVVAMFIYFCKHDNDDDDNNNSPDDSKKG